MITIHYKLYENTTWIEAECTVRALWNWMDSIGELRIRANTPWGDLYHWVWADYVRVGKLVFDKIHKQNTGCLLSEWNWPDSV